MPRIQNVRPIFSRKFNSKLDYTLCPIGIKTNLVLLPLHQRKRMTCDERKVLPIFENRKIRNLNIWSIGQKFVLLPKIRFK
jgi:hypothetical protein